MFVLTSRKTEIGRSARGPKLQGPRAEDATAEPHFVQKIFGDLITADHKVLSENCESRNNHRYAVVVQDLATQWIQSYPCKTKTSQETQRSLQKFLEPHGKPKVIYTDNSQEFGKSCEDLSQNHCTSTPHRSEEETNFGQSRFGHPDLTNFGQSNFGPHYRLIMKTILQEKEKIHYSTTIWFTNLFLSLKL